MSFQNWANNLQMFSLYLSYNMLSEIFFPSVLSSRVLLLDPTVFYSFYQLPMTGIKFSHCHYPYIFFPFPYDEFQFQKIMKKITNLSPVRKNRIYRPTKCILFVFVFANKMASSADKETVLCFLKRDFVCAAAERKKNKI